jgi:hypothetical protein
LAGALDALPPVTVRVGTDGGTLSAAVSVRGFRAKLPTLTEKLVAWLEQVGLEADGSAIPRGVLDR